MAHSSSIPYVIKIAGIDLNFELAINTKADLAIAEDVIEYVMGKVRSQVREKEPAQVNSDSLEAQLTKQIEQPRDANQTENMGLA